MDHATWNDDQIRLYSSHFLLNGWPPIGLKRIVRHLDDAPKRISANQWYVFHPSSPFHGHGYVHILEEIFLQKRYTAVVSLHLRYLPMK
ncbi:hypothetical protein NPIL_611661 [Nephila pilipes]|uniref:Uncharacterized protein n=1 Tax=Nephila pilipes TaxID=299642 RepID=A0A8X6MSK7_NEPPI|nr:hypothetical protein NPIL_611661 [Nephila pilipes]